MESSGCGDGDISGEKFHLKCSQPPNKKPKLKPFCMIHNSEEDIETNLVQLRDLSSWNSLLNAAQIRQYKPIIELETHEGVVPSVFYHRNCRSKFTLKRDLDAIQQKAQASTSSESGLRRTERHVSVASPIYEQKCIFCETNKYKKGTRTREELVKCVDLRSDKTLREKAIEKQDGNIIGLLSRDIVAAEAHYHRSCYRNYTRSKTSENDNKCEHEQDSAEISYSEAENIAHNNLFDFMRNGLFPNPEVISLRSLTEKLATYMSQAGISQMQDSTKKHLRRKLEAEFDSAIQIFPDDKGKLLIIPASLTIFQLAKENQKLLQEIKDLKARTTDQKSISIAAQDLRNILKENKIIDEWPHHPESVDKSMINIPSELSKFLLILLTGEAYPKKASQRIHWLIDSFAQDLIYAVSCGTQKPPKHILLSAAIKGLTGNVELIQAINRLGHGVSYSQVQENETALVLQKLSSAKDGTIPLPQNILKNVFTTLSFDNTDFLEETLTGEGTSHRVNGIIVQPIVYGPQLQSEHLAPIVKKKQRSITPSDIGLPVYNTGQRKGPGLLITLDKDRRNIIEDAFKKDILWILARLVDVKEQSISSWTGFNITIQKDNEIVPDRIGYLPTINAPATEMATASEILREANMIKQQLHLSSIVIVFDQALYAKVAEVYWKHRKEYPGVIIRLGIFHTLCCFLGIIGKRFRDAGLIDICIESGILAEGSVTAVMEGRHYNRAVRTHKYIYEAFMRLIYKGFPSWLDENHAEVRRDLNTTMDMISDLCADVGTDMANRIFNNQAFANIVNYFKEYLMFLKEDNGPLSSFWISYVEMVGEILLGLIRATREGNWQLHMGAIYEMIPWCFAYGRTNYSRYLPVYYADMSKLQIDYPEVYNQFQQGQFSVQIGSQNPFGRIPVDQTTEETVNKDTKVPGGIRKYSIKPGAVSRFYLSAEFRSGFLHKFRDMLGLGKCDVSHVELQIPRIKRDEAAVTTVLETIENWINPFDGPKEIVSLSTATALSDEISKDLLKAKEIGQDAYKHFKERLEDEDPKFKFHDVLPKPKLKTFSNMSKKKMKVKSSGKEVILKADRKLFGQMIVIAQARKDLNMKTVLSHPLGPLPWSLSTPDGQPRKTNKAALAKELQKNIAIAEVIPGNAATIIDGMALVQKTKGEGKTFQQVARSLLSNALRESANGSRVDVVFDVYQKQSIKNTERLSRSKEPSIQYKNIAGGHIVRQWRKFLQSTDNKTALIHYLVNEWKSPESREFLSEDIELYVAYEKYCCKITANSSELVPALECNQEEADTRILLHAAHAAEDGSSSIVIVADDTDVFLLCVAFSNTIKVPIFQKCGTSTRTRFVDINKIASVLGHDVCNGILGMHAFTGCDSVSAMAGRGKIAALKLLQSRKDVQQLFSEMGTEWKLSIELFKKLNQFTCVLYGCKSASMNVNQFRYDLFCSRKGEIESHQLPPCEDCLFKHSERANYTTAIWKRCFQPKANIPSPVGYGWKLEKVDSEQELVIDWMKGDPAPNSVLELLACSCTRSCTATKCPCIDNRMKCSDMCKLKTCENQESDEDNDFNPSDEEDIDELDEEF